MIKKFKIFKENHHWDDDYDETYDDRDIPSNDNNDDIESTLSLIRKALRSAGINNYFVDNRDSDIVISFYTNITERLNDVIIIFDVITKLKKDILPQYLSEFDMYQNRKNENILEFGFYGSDNMPF